MNDGNTPLNDDQSLPEIVESGPGNDEEEQDQQAPRRAASAEFIVESEVGSATALRDAMDPANQSLADALRLSFRILQIVILILIVLFLGSGVVTVKDSEGGVLTRWGKIVTYGESQALEGGLKWSKWPYPVGEFILFDVVNLHADVTESFLPNSKVRGYTIQQHIDRSVITDRYRTGVDGVLLSRDGDIVHVSVIANYEIIDPVNFLQSVQLSQADQIVKVATEQSMIHVVSTVSLQEMMDITDDIKQRIHQSTQQALDKINCGIQIRQITMPEPPRPPYAIVGTFTDIQEARVQASAMIQQARQASEKIRNQVAGHDWRTIVGMIRDYENAAEMGEEANAEAILTEISDWFDNDAEGMSSQIISEARGYQSYVESTLGNEAKRFSSLLTTYRDHPELVIKQQWYEASAYVMSRTDAEVYIVPPSLGRMNISISGLDIIAQYRRDLRLDRENREALSAGPSMVAPYILRGEDMYMNRPGRLLDVNQGTIKGQGDNRRGGNE